MRLCVFLAHALATAALSAAPIRRAPSSRSLRTRSVPPVLLGAPPGATAGSVLFVVEGERPSPFGATSPQLSPTWKAVATHLAGRIPGFDARLSAAVVDVSDLDSVKLTASRQWDIVVALGVQSASAVASASDGATALGCYDCDATVSSLQRVGSYRKSPDAASNLLQSALVAVAPWYVYMYVDGWIDRWIEREHDR